MFGDLDDGVMLLKTESLRNLFAYGDKSTSEIVAEFAKNNSMFSTLPQDSFQRFSWSELQHVKYATLSYTSSTKWTTLLEFVFGINGVESEFLLFDEFCLGGSKKGLDSKKVFSALSKLMASSSEHHIMEPGSLLKGWTWHNLSLLSPIVRPILHSSTIDIPLIEMLMDNIKSSGFDCAEFTVPEDRDKVNSSIIERWGTIDAFNSRVLDTVGNALDLAQVNY